MRQHRASKIKATSSPLAFSTKELSVATWPDFEKLFLKRGLVGDAWWCWCTHHHVSSYSHDEKSKLRTREERCENNRKEKRALVNDGCAHGVLVYAADDPVGWCQYGLREELPRTDNSRNYRKFSRSVSQGRMWRITCFVVDENYRWKGLASFALGATLESIKRRGGGMVESYPVIETDQGSNYLYCGTVEMFERAGFRIVGPYAAGRTRTVVMRRRIRGARST